MENKSKSRKTTKEMDLKDLYILSFYFTGYDFIVTKQKKMVLQKHVSDHDQGH